MAKAQAGMTSSSNYVSELEETIKRLKRKIVKLENEVKVLEQRQWLREVCGDDLW